MHELGVVFHIIDQVEEVAKDNDVSSVSKIILQLGEVSTVIPEYLTDCFVWARAKHELIREAELEIETIPAITRCGGCDRTYGTVKYGKICPYCGSDRTWLEQGSEFMIKEIEAV